MNVFQNVNKSLKFDLFLASKETLHYFLARFLKIVVWSNKVLLLFSIFFVIICWLSWIGEKYSWTWTVYSQCNRTKVCLNPVLGIHLIYFLIKTWIRIVDPPWKMLIRIRKKVIRISSRYKAFFLFKKFFNILFYFFSL